MPSINHKRMFICNRCALDKGIRKEMLRHSLQMNTVSKQRVSLCRYCEKRTMGASVEFSIKHRTPVTDKPDG